jgi:glycosyltransferase involved in cell wall biosynthesis
MRILLVCPDWFPYSAGLAQSALELSQELIRKGHKVVVATADRGNHDKKGMRLIEVPLLFVMLGRNPICHGVYRTLKKEIKKADCIILFSYMFELNFRITLLRFFRFFQKSIIHMYRGSLENYGLKGVGLATRFGKWLWDNTCAWWIFRGTDATISNSGPTLKIIHKKYRVKTQKLHYIKTGMYLDQFNISKGNSKRVIFIGRLVDNKGVHLFPQIIKNIPKNWTRYIPVLI